MAEPRDHTDAASRRPEERGDHRRAMDAEVRGDVPRTSRDRDEESGSGVLKFFGLELGMFAAAVILGVVFLIAIIVFAVTR